MEKEPVYCSFCGYLLCDCDCELQEEETCENDRGGTGHGDDSLSDADQGL